MAVCLLFLIALLNPAVSVGDEDPSPMVLDDPVSTTVYLNTEGTFRCEVTSELAHWNVNGTPITNLSNSDLDSTHDVTDEAHVLCTLHIVAKAEYNGSVIQCVASKDDGRFSRSQNATLFIQGLLAAVGDLTVKNSQDSILLSWNPPFSLDVTGVDPDIWYTVLITNVTNENSIEEVPCSDCHNLTHPSYTFTTANPSPSHRFSFTVTPLNGLGSGNISEPVLGAFVDDVQPSPTSTFFSSSDAAVQTSLTPTPTASPNSGIPVLSSVLIFVVSLIAPIMCKFCIFTPAP